MSPEPVQSGYDAATNNEKIQGIIAQTRADIDQGNVTDIADALRQRFADTGLVLTDADFERVLASVNATQA